MKILCVCNQGENRSRTAAYILAAEGKHEVIYDGFYRDKYNYELKSREVFDSKNLDRADKIIVFEEAHEDIVKKHGYRYWGKPYNFHIQDMYYFNQASLRAMIINKLKRFELI